MTRRRQRSVRAWKSSAGLSARPGHLEHVEQSVLALGDTEIHARAAIGKLIVVLEDARTAQDLVLRT